jgi:hypothetical protein
MKSPSGDKIVPFKFLGFQPWKGTQGKYRLYFSINDHVTMIQDRHLFKSGANILFTIAAPDFWEYEFGNKDGIRWDMANSWIIHTSFKAGIYKVPDDGKRKILTGRNSQK